MEFNITHRMNIFKHFLHADQFVVQLIVGGGAGQKRVSIRDEQIKDLHHLQVGGECKNY